MDIILKEKGIDPVRAGSTKLTMTTTKAKERFDAAVFVSGLNSQQYQGLVDNLSNIFLNVTNPS